jgi:hypothetical protein
MSKRDILVVVRNQSISDDAIERELQNLDRVLLRAETIERFCISHELVDRNRITNKRSRLLKETRFQTLRPFRFLINKN